MRVKSYHNGRPSIFGSGRFGLVDDSLMPEVETVKDTNRKMQRSWNPFQVGDIKEDVHSDSTGLVREVNRVGPKFLILLLLFLLPRFSGSKTTSDPRATDKPESYSPSASQWSSALPRQARV
jgi:hypothetical protein